MDKKLEHKLALRTLRFPFAFEYILIITVRIFDFGKKKRKEFGTERPKSETREIRIFTRSEIVSK